MATNSGGWLYEANGTPVDKATADNAQARVLEIKQSADTASTDATKALQTANAYAGQIAQANTTAGSAVAIANDAKDTVETIEGPISTRLGALEVIGGLEPGDVSDATVQNLITQESTGTRAALNAQSVQVANAALQVKLGAEIVPGALDFPALQAAADAARVSGRRLWAAGTLTTDQTLVIRSDADLGGLTINYTGAGVAVQVGEAATSLREKQGTLPRVAEGNNAGAGQWVDTRVGIQLVNNDSCVWLIPHVKDFGVGLEELGEGRGHAYNTITIGHLANNKVNHRLRATTGGWANQNTHIGGRFGHNSSEGVSTPGTRHIQIMASGNVINNNAWLNTSIEANTAEYHAEVSGMNNLFLNVRWEAAQPKILWKSGSYRNQVMYGYGSQHISETFESGVGTGNIVHSDTRQRLSFSNSGPVHVLENASGDANPVDAILNAGATVAGTDPSTGYTVMRSAVKTGMKRGTDAHDRLRMDHQNALIYFGAGTAEPDKAIGVAGSGLRLDGFQTSTSATGGSATALPAAPVGYLSIFTGGQVRKIPYY